MSPEHWPPNDPRIREQIDRFDPLNFDLEQTGWDTFAQYMLDISGLIQKPHDPSGVWGDEEQEAELQGQMTAIEIETLTVNTLTQAGMGHLIGPYQESMAHYRKVVRHIISRWRELGVL